MRYKLLIFMAVVLGSILVKSEVYADVLYSDWIGTLDKSYELAWQQKESGVYNGYRTYFFLEYTYSLNGSKKYPTYCIEYYKKGPRENSDYGKTKLKNTNMDSAVRNGIVEIIKNGYPNVSNPYGTQDVSEAYYATSAAIHIWTMYHGVDELAGEYLGWFTYKDGFSMKKSNLDRYISDLSTSSTTSGWHQTGPNSNAASRRTWVAAIKLLKDAINADVKEPYITIKLNKDSYFDKSYLVYEYVISSNVCSNLQLKLNKTIQGCKIEYSTEKNHSVIAKLYIPASSVKSGDSFSLYGCGSVKGADDIENYYYLYHNTGQYQTMVYLENDKSREIRSDSLNCKIPVLEYKTYYDLNYSGKNYINDSNFTDINKLSYNGEKSISKKGNINYSLFYMSDSGAKRLNVSFNSTGAENCLYINTLLNSSVTSGFKSAQKEILTFSCWVRSNNKTSLMLCFEKSNTVYEKEISAINEWIKIDITITKSDAESNILCIYSDSVAVIDFKTMQIESGNKFSEYVAENSPDSSPFYTVHKYGEKYGKLYNGVVPQREYYVFLGWNTKKDGTGIYVNNSDDVPYGHQVLYAIWTTQDTYNVYFHYDANGGNYLVKNSQYIANTTGYDVIEVPNNSDLDIQVAAYRNGYEFIGWSYENNLISDIENSVIDSVYVDGKDVHLYANFKKVHKIRFHYYDEQSESEQIIVSEERYSYNNKNYIGIIFMPGYKSENLLLKIPEVSGYKLKGWSISENSYKDVDYKAGESEDVCTYDDYYAVYEKNVTVKFYDNVYGSEFSDYHEGSSYLHCDYKLPVYMNSKGIITQAEFTLPKNVCDVNEYVFYGWSDNRLFDGSVCYYADEKGISVMTDVDLRFYALYVIKRTVSYFDYDFDKGFPHLEKQLYSYEYMNYNGDVYNPEIIIQAPCPVYDGWNFDGWSVDSLVSDEKKYYTEDKFLVTKDVAFFANYNEEVKVKIHTLECNNNVTSEIINTIPINVKMDCMGTFYTESIVLPEIEPFEDDFGWGGIGYSDISDDDINVTYEQSKEYDFLTDTDLYAIYITDIRVNYFDYCLSDDLELTKNEYYEMYKTCSNELSGVEIILSKPLSSDTHTSSWWIKSGMEEKYYPDDEIIIYNNTDFFAKHSDVYTLTCNDYENGVLRVREYNSIAITDHNGSISPGIVVVPEQGTHDEYAPTNYWSMSSAVTADYWSGESVKLYADMFINAIYSKPVNIVYDANSGVFDTGESIKTDVKNAFYNVIGDKKVPSFTPLYEPVKDGNIFTGEWNTELNGGGNIYWNGISFTSEEDIRLYALWEAAGSPKLSVIDRYFFVGEEITYEDITEKIIALDSYGKASINDLKIIKINNRNTEELTKDEIETKIVADYPRQYNLDVRFVCDGQVFNDSFVIYIIDKYERIDRLRYISEEFIDSLDDDSKWKYGLLFGKLIMTFNKDTDDAEYIYTFQKEGVE